MAKTLDLFLAPGRDKSVRQGNPWIFSGAIARKAGPSGAPLARVLDAKGRFLGTGFYSPRSQIRVRLVRRDEGPVGQVFFSERLAEALDLRRSIVPPDTDGYRVLNAEGDGLPGWTVDRYGDLLVSQITSSGLEALRGPAYGALADHFPDHAILQVNPPTRRREGLATGDDEWIRGESPGEVRFRESGLELSAELGGQKTGFYLDQRPSRRRVEALAADRTMLDLFAHSGAFTAYGLRGGATSVTAVESAARLEERAFNHLRWNNLPTEPVRWVGADVFEFLREEKSRHGVVVCDPPPLVRNRHRLDAGARAYKDLNRLAMTHVENGGFLLSFSCSGAVDGKLFRQILFSAATEAEVRVRLLAPLAAGEDHPVDLGHPQGEYLKGWLMEVHRELRR